MHAAVAAGIHPDITAASAAMGKARRNAYRPDDANAPTPTTQLYAHYSVLHDYFGRGTTDARASPALAGQAPHARTRRSPTCAALVCDLHAELPKHGLVVWTSGNLSARVPGEELMVIKASGVDFEAMTPETVVVCDLFGELVDGELAPVQRCGHARLRLPPHARGRRRRTHAQRLCDRFRRSWRAYPCVLTAIADEFGGEIPIGPFARIGDEEIGRGIVETLTGHRSPAVLMRSHGVFTVGRNAARCDQGGGHV